MYEFYFNLKIIYKNKRLTPVKFFIHSTSVDASSIENNVEHPTHHKHLKSTLNMLKHNLIPHSRTGTRVIF